MKLGWGYSYQSSFLDFLGQLTFQTLVNVKTVQEAHVPAEKPILNAVHFASAEKIARTQFNYFDIGKLCLLYLPIDTINWKQDSIVAMSMTK